MSNYVVLHLHDVEVEVAGLRVDDDQQDEAVACHLPGAFGVARVNGVMTMRALWWARTVNDAVHEIAEGLGQACPGARVVRAWEHQVDRCGEEPL